MEIPTLRDIIIGDKYSRIKDNKNKKYDKERRSKLPVRARLA